MKLSLLAEFVKVCQTKGIRIDQFKKALTHRIGTVNLDNAEVQETMDLLFNLRWTDETEGLFESLKQRFSESVFWFNAAWDDYNNLTCGARNRDNESIYLQRPDLAFWYCMIATDDELHKAPVEFKKVIVKDPEYAVKWAAESDRNWKTGGTAHQTISKSAEWSVKYAYHNGMRFLLGEPAIEADPKWNAEYQRLMDEGEIDPEQSIEEDLM